MPLPANSFTAFLDAHSDSTSEKNEAKVPFEGFFCQFEETEISASALTEI